MKKRITGNARGYSLKKCARCGLNYRRIWKTKGKQFCYNCYVKASGRKICGFPTSNPIPLEKALQKIYVISKGHYNKNGSLQVSRSFPSCLANKKVKLMLVE